MGALVFPLPSPVVHGVEMLWGIAGNDTLLLAGAFPRGAVNLSGRENDGKFRSSLPPPLRCSYLAQFPLPPSLFLLSLSLQLPALCFFLICRSQTARASLDSFLSRLVDLRMYTLLAFPWLLLVMFVFNLSAAWLFFLGLRVRHESSSGFIRRRALLGD